MKKVLHVLTISIVLLLVIAGMQQAFARGGFGRHCLVILDGEPMNVSGTVSECCLGQGLQIDTGNEMITLYGLGPIWYWEQMGSDRPIVGDQVESDTRLVTFSDGTTRPVMMNIRINGVEVQLRDPATGCPLWR